jgi:tripartite motif-containing protein 71
MSRVKVVPVCGLAALNLLMVGSPGGSVAEAPAAVKYVCAGVWGWRGTEDGDFINPGGIAVASDGTVYVVDRSNWRVQYFTPTGSFLGKWGSKGERAGEFISPRGIAVSPQGDVYVTDVETNRVQCFTSAGSYVREWHFESDEPGQYWQGEEYDAPIDIAAGPNGRIYILGDMSDQVHEYTPVGSLVCEWGDMSYWGPGVEGWSYGAPGPAGNFWNANGIAVAPNGDVYVADTGYHRVQYFSATGSFKGMWGEEGNEKGEFEYPRSLAVSRDGDLYVADRGNARVQLFSASGSFITQWGVEGYGWGEFAGLSDVAIGPDGTVYATEKDGDRVQFFTRTSHENDQ